MRGIGSPLPPLPPQALRVCRRRPGPLYRVLGRVKRFGGSAAPLRLDESLLQRSCSGTAAALAYAYTGWYAAWRRCACLCDAKGQSILPKGQLLLRSPGGRALEHRHQWSQNRVLVLKAATPVSSLLFFLEVL